MSKLMTLLDTTPEDSDGPEYQLVRRHLESLSRQGEADATALDSLRALQGSAVFFKSRLEELLRPASARHRKDVLRRVFSRAGCLNLSIHYAGDPPIEIQAVMFSRGGVRSVYRRGGSSPLISVAEDFLTSYGTARAKEAHTRLLGILLPEAPPEVPEHYGWDIFQTDRVPGFELQKVEPVGKFADDLDAWKDVGQRVTARDIPTLNVLRFLEKYSPLEYNKISVYLKEVQSISLSDELRRG